jgi:hypothetical protein
MKLYTALKLAVAGGFLLAAPAFAQNSVNVRVKVPFAFHVGGQVLPAGEYDMKAAAGSSMVLIQNSDGKTENSSMVLSKNEGAIAATDDLQLTFRVYGAARYLDGIWAPGKAGRSVPVSPAESQTAMNRVPETLALVLRAR